MVVHRKNNEIKNQKTRVTPRSPSKVVRSFFEVLGRFEIFKAFHQKVHNKEDKGAGNNMLQELCKQQCLHQTKCIDCRAGKQQSTHVIQRAVEENDSPIRKRRRFRIVLVIRLNPVYTLYDIFDERHCTLYLWYFTSISDEIRRLNKERYDVLAMSFFTVEQENTSRASSWSFG